MTQNVSTFVLQLKISRKVVVNGRQLDREEFFAWLWDRYGERGLVGVHEGTLLSEQAAEQGLETDSFTIDAAQAPRERDWIAAQGEASVEAYFASEAEARRAREELIGVAGLVVGAIVEQKPQDWDAEWKKSFLNASEGVPLPPFWRVLPAWVGEELVDGRRRLAPGERALLINPGAGFGTGTHETTQLCLEAVGEFSLRRPLAGARVLDFGSGSGILAIGAALLGARVFAVEIDELAVENARENARINGVEERIGFTLELSPGVEKFPLVIANILRPVLIQFAPELVRRLEPGGCLVLSGLVEGDVEEIVRVFSGLLGGARPRVGAKGEWRSVVW